MIKNLEVFQKQIVKLIKLNNHQYSHNKWFFQSKLKNIKWL